MNWAKYASLLETLVRPEPAQEVPDPGGNAERLDALIRALYPPAIAGDREAQRNLLAALRLAQEVGTGGKEDGKATARSVLLDPTLSDEDLASLWQDAIR